MRRKCAWNTTSRFSFCLAPYLSRRQGTIKAKTSKARTSLQRQDSRFARWVALKRSPYNAAVPCSVARRRLEPGAGDGIAHGHEEHYGEPEDGSDDHELGALGAVFRVHEEEDDERGFEDGDGQGDDDIQAGEICVEIDLGGGNRQNGADHENTEY